MGYGWTECPVGLCVHAGPLHGSTIETHDDHRIAMSFAVAGLRVHGIVIGNPACAAKTYPRFFDDLGGIITA